jgi:dTDP-4-dehydrorhamnose 3,5-epimerase
MMFKELYLKGAYEIELNFLSDERGGFARFFCENEFKEIGLNKHFVQMNHSYNTLKGTVRGMHFQKQPYLEVKLIRCIKGSLIDVIIDLRRHSDTFLKHVKVELSESNRKMIFIPEGFAHGFQTLENNTELIYHHTQFYNSSAEDGLRYNDEVLNINWPLPVSIISDRDKNHSLIDNNFKGV